MTALAAWRPSPRGERALLAGAWALQLAVLLAVGSHHEPWRDEADAWLFLRDGSLSELWGHLKHTANGGLWHVLLAPIVRAGLPPAAMTFLNAGIVSAGIAIFLRWAPLPLPIKLLLPFSVLPLHEYGVVARSYGLSFALLMALCALLASPRPRPIATGLALALFANTNVHSLILGAGLGLFWLIDSLGRRGRDGAAPPGRIALGMVIAQCGALLAIAILLPPDDAQNIPPLWKVPKTFWTSLRDAFATPIPWRFGGMLGGAALLVVLGLAAARVELFALAAASVGLLTFLFLVVYPPFLRHAGFYWLLAVALLWLERKPGAAPSRLRTAAAVAFGLSLLFSVREGVVRSVADWREPFTGAPEAAAFLDSLDLTGAVVAAFPAGHCEAILLHTASLKQFWYPGHAAWGSYMPWNTSFVQGMVIPPEEALRRLRRAHPEPEPLVFVTMRRLRHPESAGLVLRFETAKPRKAFKEDEHFYVYTSPGIRAR